MILIHIPVKALAYNAYTELIGYFSYSFDVHSNGICHKCVRGFVGATVPRRFILEYLSSKLEATSIVTLFLTVVTLQLSGTAQLVGKN